MAHGRTSDGPTRNVYETIMTDSQTMDPAALERLREWGGEKLLSEMVRLFLENSPARMQQIRDGMDQEDAKQVERAAHSLKSSAANIGALKVRALSAEFEQAASAGHPERMAEKLATLEDAYAKAIEALESVEKGTAE